MDIYSFKHVYVIINISWLSHCIVEIPPDYPAQVRPTSLNSVTSDSTLLHQYCFCAIIITLTITAKVPRTLVIGTPQRHHVLCLVFAPTSPNCRVSFSCDLYNFTASPPLTLLICIFSIYHTRVTFLHFLSKRITLHATKYGIFHSRDIWERSCQRCFGCWFHTNNNNPKGNQNLTIRVYDIRWLFSYFSKKRIFYDGQYSIRKIKKNDWNKPSISNHGFK